MKGMSVAEFEDRFNRCCGGFSQIETNEAPLHMSNYGNRFLTITDEDLEALRTGKILCTNDGEYCTFVRYEPNDETE